MFKDTHNKDNQAPYDPQNLYKSLQLANADLLDGKQQDAHEFWMRIMRVFEKRMNSSTMFERWISHDVITNVKCGTCYKNFETVRKVNQHIIDVRGHHSVQKAVDAYFEGDILETYKCEACKGNNDEKAKKSYYLKSVPNIFSVVLNRFENKNKKYKNNIEISKQLKLTNFSSSSETVGANYKLVSVINHIGENISSGHYTAIACCSNTFHEFNDSRVERTDAINGYNAYILFYELLAKVFRKLLTFFLVIYINDIRIFLIILNTIQFVDC